MTKEPGLIGRRRQINTTVEHCMKEPVEFCIVCRSSRGKINNGFLAEMHADHASQLIDDEWCIRCFQNFIKTVMEILSFLLQVIINGRIVPEGRQQCKARNHCEGVPA